MIDGRAPAIDTLFRFPSEEEDSATIAARKLTRDSASHGYTKHPAGYLFDEKKGVQGQTATADEMVAMMDRFNVRIAQIDVNPLDPDPVLAILERYPTRFFGEIRIDSNAGMVAVRQIDELVRAHRNIRSVMLYPCLCNPQVPIDDKKHYPIYAKCSELGIPVNVLVGVPGPRVPYKCQHPGLLDEVAWFFPDLKIVMRHGGDPWTDLCVKLLLKWPNLYYSTSAWAPKHYPKNIMEFAEKRGRDKVLFAGYFPWITYERTFSELDEHIHLSDEVYRRFLFQNAVDVYGLHDLVEGDADRGASATGGRSGV